MTDAAFVFFGWGGTALAIATYALRLRHRVRRGSAPTTRTTR